MSAACRRLQSQAFRRGALAGFTAGAAVVAFALRIGMAIGAAQ